MESEREGRSEEKEDGEETREKEEAREQRHSDSRGREERECQDGQMELTNKANRKKHGQDWMRSRGFLHPDAFFLCSSQAVWRRKSVEPTLGSTQTPLVRV